MSINPNARMRNAARRGTMQLVPYTPNTVAVPRGQRGTLSALYNTVRTAYNVGRQVYPIVQRGVRLYNQYRASRPAPRPVASSRYVAPMRKAPLKRQVRNLQMQMSSTTGTLTYTSRFTQRFLSNVNAKAYGVMAGDITVSRFETVLGELRFFDPTTPGTLVQGSGATATYARKYHFATIHSAMHCKNNYQVPCKVSVYCLTPKDDTSINPATAYENGLADVGNPSNTSPLVNITDSPQFNQLWRIRMKKSKVLQAGQSFNVKYAVKDVMYAPDLVDSHSQAYQSRFKCQAWLVVVEGLLGHDTSADQQGFLQAGVDCSNKVKYVVKYDAGADIKYHVIADDADTFTNGGVVSSKPVADNLPYSVA